MSRLIDYHNEQSKATGRVQKGEEEKVSQGETMVISVGTLVLRRGSAPRDDLEKLPQINAPLPLIIFQTTAPKTFAATRAM